MKNMIFRTSEVAQGGANVAVVNSDGAMAGDSISKHRRSDTSLKGRRKYFGLVCSLLLALCVGFSSCGDDDDNGGGTGGVLTITNLSEFNGKYVYVMGSTSDEIYYDDLEGYEKISGGEYFFVKISNGEAKVPMFHTPDQFARNVPYKGNNTRQDLSVYICDGATNSMGTDIYDSSVYIGGVRVDFTDGNATTDWRTRLNHFEVIEGRPQGYLTVTGLTSHDGMHIRFFVIIENDNRFYGYEKYGWIDKVVGYRTSYVKISGGQAKIPAVVQYYKDEGRYLDYILPYTGNDKGVRVTLQRYSSTDVHGTGSSFVRSIDNVDFTNGNATVDVSDW